MLHLYFFRIFARYIYKSEVELITNILIEYLKHNKRLVVPKLGAFIVKQPSGIIRFSELMRSDDGVLRSLLTAYGAKEIEAMGMIDRLVFEIHHAIGQGNTFTIEGFGEFSPGDNNTITFKHFIEPKTFSGKIKPPVETFDAERDRVLRAMGREVTPRPKVDTAEKHKTTPEKREKKEVESASIVKPDAYLRGLNYDKANKGRRGDERGDGRRKGGTRTLVVLLLILLAAGIVWGLWMWRGDITPATYNNDTATDIETDTLLDMEADSTLINNVDITTAEEANENKTEDISSNNSYLNPQF